MEAEPEVVVGPTGRQKNILARFKKEEGGARSSKKERNGKTNIVSRGRADPRTGDQGGGKTAPVGVDEIFGTCTPREGEQISRRIRRER